MDRMISIVVPAYNEAANLPVLCSSIADVLNTVVFEIIIVDDGSVDHSREVLKQLHSEDPRIKYAFLSRNFGHQQALRCGILLAKGDAVITMDADLQHPPVVIPTLLDAWQKGNEIVITKRNVNNELPFTKRMFSRVFYQFINFISDIRIEPGAADFRLLDRKVIELINNSHESDLFLRGYVEWVGFRKQTITYSADERFAGKAQYTFKKSLELGLSGITSFSVKPLRISALAGAVISVFAFAYALYALAIYFFTDRAITGWASLLVSILFIGGLQLIMIGILGEYVGRMFMQVKGRPSFIVAEKSEA